ncbi:hypothetical protein FOXB_05846 [Fusarium oxysporum f. sp. conglutinans Fo5176]|uniref:Uncharacterized protein n=1 Tax=Fusarium oxysporum (strain Fo5176) TaxID=660025 RepID=F9FHG7_FUSOF|nr:hypothetical protein FOXB_05846 [Fusarium oxysporum f. sp. conglutinans Fo5176]
MADETTGTNVRNAKYGSKDQGKDFKVVHAQHLMEFLRPIHTESILACEKYLSNSVPQVAFDMIWYPLKPGTDGAGSDGSWLVDLWRLETDGSRLRRGFISKRINPYSGLLDLVNLPVCPVSIWDANNGGERREKILRRSTTLFKALQRGNLLVDYKGPIKETAQYYTGKVVIDHRRGRAESDINLPPQINHYFDRFHESFYTTQDTQTRLPNRKSQRAGSNDAVVNGDELQAWLNDVPEHRSPEMIRAEAGGSVVEQLTEHQLILLCPDALAYGLRRKHWMMISLDYVQESVPSNESISNLIIAQDELKTIQALSNRQNSPPGVGKTYTVVADIGTVETLVEGELMKWFDLAEAWNAVLLVDEADIFLERRQNRDLARNELVSAFLRRMEYFKGLLFLTTNRVGQIDDAFISRVHVAIGYQALNEETRRKVWSGFFRKLVRERAGKVQIASDAKKWVLETAGETSLNGRDIRNALQTAITLAEFESEEDPDYDAALVTVVTKAHFQKVLEMCNRFRSYVTSIRREDEMKRAQGRGDRNDYGNGFDSRMC